MTIAISAIAGMVVAFGGAYLLIKEVKPDSSPSQAAASVPQSASEPSAASQVQETLHETSQNKLEKIFTPDMLDADLAYLETITGVAKSTYGNSKTYKVNGCEVEVRFAGKQITSLGLTLSKSCQVNPSKFVNTTVQSTKNLTFGALDKSLGNVFHYQAPCLSMCGNAAGLETISAIYSGSHAENFIDVQIEATPEPEVDTSPWVETMERQEGSDWVESGGYNCSPKYDDIARKTLAKQRINKITFGRDLPTETCN